MSRTVETLPAKMFAAERWRLWLLTLSVTCAMTTFSVAAKQGGQYDGPAELPIATVPSAMADTPTPGAIISVSAGGDLQAAMNGAACGDVIELQAGSVFSGQFTVPAKNCDINHWIVIRTSSADSALPAEGQRATPCYAGVASLVGRPQYPCPNPQNVLAMVQMQIQGSGPFQFANGANYYRLIGLEVTRASGTPGDGQLISALGTADHIIVDRSWLHGGPQDETYNGVSLSGMTNAAVIDSYFNDFHCIAITGLCTDAAAISGGVSNTQDGPFKIQDNFLEASGEGVMFGGGASVYSPSDIEILNNHFWKPWQWMPGNPNFVGGANGEPFIVKNHLELKNAVRVLIDSNLMENVWGGFTQTGYGVLLTPKNQHAGHKNVCPKCEVTDVTLRFSQISHAGGGLQLATAISGDGKRGGPALAGERWSIHDLVLDDLSDKYVGGGTAFEILNGWKENPLNTVTINHVTAFPEASSHMIIVGTGYDSARMYGLVFTNNLVVTGRFPVWNTGGRASCGHKDVPITSLKNCFTTQKFSTNGLITPPPQFPPSTWPANNMFAPTIDYVGFTDYNDGNGGNYELLSSSPYKHKGSDGKDLGADIVALQAALVGVE